MPWVPNAISIARALAAIPVVLLVTSGTALSALALFSAAALTDALDGALARRLRATSATGAFLDPLADKLLVLGTLAGLLGLGAVDPLPVGLILARELAVTATRALGVARGSVIAASRYGKAKAVLQGTAVAVLLAAVALPALGLGPLAETMLGVAAVVTVVTGADVLRRASAALATPPRVRAHVR